MADISSALPAVRWPTMGDNMESVGKVSNHLTAPLVTAKVPLPLVSRALSELLVPLGPSAERLDNPQFALRSPSEESPFGPRLQINKLSLPALVSVSANSRYSARQRLQASVQAGDKYLQLGRINAAEVLYLRGFTLNPKSQGLALLHAGILQARGLHQYVLSEALPGADGGDPWALLAKARSQYQLGSGQAALATAQEATTRARASYARDGNAGPLQAALANTAYIEFFHAKDPERAIAMVRESLALGQDHRLSHSLLAQWVAPGYDESHATRIGRSLRELFGARNSEDTTRIDRSARIDDLFKQAQANFDEGTKAALTSVKAQALEILALDPNEGMAHGLYSAADSRLSVTTARAALNPSLDSPEKQLRLAKHLQDQFALYGSTPKYLLPDWPTLSLLQKAVVAQSMLPYAGVLQQLIRVGEQHHLPGVTEPIMNRMVQRSVRRRMSDGRYMYGGRGVHIKGRAVTGRETLDLAAYGQYNTFAHEFTHQVFNVLLSLPRWSRTTRKIRRLYHQAREGKDGQALIEPYAGTTLQEYVAEGAMAYIQKMSSGSTNSYNLLDRNPAFWHELNSLFTKLSRFPAGAEGVVHAVETLGPSRTPLELRRQARESSNAEEQAQIRRRLKAWDSLYRKDVPASSERKLLAG